LKLKTFLYLVSKFANFFQNPEMNERNETAKITPEMKLPKSKLLRFCVER